MAPVTGWDALPSRSDALAWCVKLVGQHEGDWIARLREAMDSVAQVRAEGPAA